MWSGDEFFVWDGERCWICGDAGKLTGEHKFKASDLRSSFGSEPMLGFLGHDPKIPSRERPIQSPKSKFAKFRPSICARCNNSRTQLHDRAYDALSDRIRELMAENREPFEVSREQPWCDGLDPLTVASLRYLAKHMGCLAADVEMPIPSLLPQFILERVEYGQLYPTVYSNRDLKGVIVSEREITANFARVGHSGLALMFDKNLTAPNAYRFGIEIDWAWIEVRYNFSISEAASLEQHFPEKVQYAREQALLNSK